MVLVALRLGSAGWSHMVDGARSESCLRRACRRGNGNRGADTDSRQRARPGPAVPDCGRRAAQLRRDGLVPARAPPPGGLEQHDWLTRAKEEVRSRGRGRSVKWCHAARESRFGPRWRTASALWERAAICGWDPGHGGHFRDVLRRRKLDWCQGGQPNSPDRRSRVGHLRSESARALAFGLPQTPSCQCPDNEETGPQEQAAVRVAGSRRGYRP
jgi:hypothetical protein